MFAQGVGIDAGQAEIDPDVFSDGPTQLLETLHKRRHTSLRVRVVNIDGHEHADAPNPLGLLRKSCKRPSSG
jgi:hypothetical protein